MKIGSSDLHGHRSLRARRQEPGHSPARVADHAPLMLLCPVQRPGPRLHRQISLNHPNRVQPHHHLRLPEESMQMNAERPVQQHPDHDPVEFCEHCHINTLSFEPFFPSDTAPRVQVTQIRRSRLSGGHARLVPSGQGWDSGRIQRKRWGAEARGAQALRRSAQSGTGAPSRATTRM